MTLPAAQPLPPLAVTITTLGLVARRKDLLQRGYTEWALRQAVKAGTISVVARGYFAVPGADPLDIRLTHYQARRTCLTKAEQLGLWVIRPFPLPHVAVAHGRPVPGCHVHRVRGALYLSDILRQCVGCGTPVEALTVMESAVVLKQCTLEELRRAFSGRGDAAARAILALIDPQSQSIVETVARYVLRAAGYNVQAQASIRGVGHLDLLVEGVLGVEIDGERYHNTPAGWAEDLRRGNQLVLAGVWTLHIPARVVLHQPEVLLTWVRQALAQIATGQPNT